MLKVQHSNYYQLKLQNNYFQPKVLLLAQPLYLGQNVRVVVLNGPRKITKIFFEIKMQKNIRSNQWEFVEIAWDILSFPLSLMGVFVCGSHKLKSL